MGSVGNNMIKTVEIVSLSSGIIGEAFAAHELKIGVKRLESMGLQVKFSGYRELGVVIKQNLIIDRYENCGIIITRL